MCTDKQEESKTEAVVSFSTGTLVFLMAWGPIVMAIGFVFGGLAGFGLSLANDMCRLRRRQSAAKKQRVGRLSFSPPMCICLPVAPENLCKFSQKITIITPLMRLYCRRLPQGRIDNLMRWANYHFATSQSQLQLIFKVIMEYQVREQTH